VYSLLLLLLLSLLGSNSLLLFGSWFV